MSKRTAALLTEALKLSEKERATLAEGILESLDDCSSEIDSMSDEELTAELNRRHEEFLRDPSVGIPLDEVKRITRIK
jgi:putative addiction module component (TIGR02574 family)